MGLLVLGSNPVNYLFFFPFFFFFFFVFGLYIPFFTAIYATKLKQ